MTVRHGGSFSNLDTFINAFFNQDSTMRSKYLSILHKYGKIGVIALEMATPTNTGKTRSSWSYIITTKKDSWSLTWTNSNKQPGGPPIVILLQYGHALRNGTYLPGIDFINPAIQPVLKQLSDELWREVTKL